MNKDVTAISDSSKCDFLSPSCPREEQHLLSGIHQPHPVVSTEDFGGCERCRILAPDSQDAYERDDSSDPICLHLPIHRKVLRSLT